MRRRDKRKREETRRRNTLIFVGGVALIMLLSGLYYIAPTQRRRTLSEEEIPQPSINQYKVERLGNFSILMKIKNKTQDLIVIPKSQITLEKINQILNFSISGLNYVSCDSTAPESENQYFFCTFNLELENASEKIKEKLDTIFRDYSLKRAYIAKLSTSIAGTNETYLIGSLDLKPKDHVRADIYIKDSGGLICFEEKKIPLGERIPAKVLNLTQYSISGEISEEFSLQEFLAKLQINFSEMKFSSPKILINKTLENETIILLNKLPEVYTDSDKDENRTIILFNKSFSNITKILDEKNITSYSMENGSISFYASLDTNISLVKKTLEDFNVEKIDVNKEGFVSFSDEVVFNEKIVKVEDSKNFPATLNLEAEEGDDVNISLSVIQFGEHVIPMGAREVEEEK